jgi:copper transport protein
MVQARLRRIEMRRVRRAAAAVLLAMGVLIGPEPIPVAAHAELVESDPAAGASLPEPPDAISLTFTEPIDPATASVRLLGTQQDAIAGVGEVMVDAARTTAEVTVPVLEPGVYTVSYQVVSAVDGHATSGLFAFLVDPTGAEPPPTTQPTSTAPAADASAIVARWVALALALGAFGTILFWARHGAAVTPGGGARQVAPWLLIAALCAGGFASLATYLALAARPLVEAGTHDVHRSFPLDFAAPFGWTPFGIAMRIALGALGVAFTIAVFRTVRLDELRRRGIEHATSERQLLMAVTALTALALLGMSLAGHVASLGGLPFAALDWVHLLAAGAWLGAIPAFAAVASRAPVADRSASLQRAMRAHGRTAMIAAPIVALTGLANSPLVLGPSRELLASGYGNLLLGKALLFSTAVGIGAVNHLLARDGRSRPRAPLVVVELAVAAAAVLVAASLVTVPPAASRQPVVSATVLGGTHLFGSAGPSTIHAAINVASPGNQRYQVVVTDASTGQPRDDIQKVFIRFMPPAEAGLAEQRVELAAAPSDPGLYETTGAFTPVIGEWTLEVIVRRSGALDEPVEFGLPVVDPVEPQLVPPPDTGIDVPAPVTILWALLPGGLAAWLPALVLLAAVALLSAVLRRVAGEPNKALAWARVVALALAIVAGGVAGSREMVAIANAPPADAVTTINPIPADAASIERGRLIYLANCSGCHGTDGAGAGAVTGYRPSDLAGVVPALTDGALAYRVTNGLAGTPMPGFATALSENDRWDLVNYLRDRWGGR